jgi:hypothetical protein
MYGKYINPTYDFKDLAIRLPYHVDATINNYKRHFETTTGGGRLMFDEFYRVGLKTYLTSTAIANRFDFNLKGFGFSDQLKIKNLIYWTGRVIDGPTGIVITIFPGIWTDIFSSPNFIPAGMQWVNSYQISQFIQKCTVLGIRIDKMTGIPLPWSGVSFVSLPPAFDIWANVRAALISEFNRSMDLLLAVHLGGQGIPIVDEMKRTYVQIIDTVFTPELLNTFNSIPSPYGLDWRTLSGIISETSEAVSPIVQSLSTVPVAGREVTQAANNACDAFLSKIIPYLTVGYGGAGGVSAGGKYGFRKVVFLAGPLGTEDQRAEYIIRRFRRDDRRFRSIEEAKENIFYLRLLERLKDNEGASTILSPLHTSVTFEQEEVDNVIARVERELKEDEELLLNRNTKPFNYITTEQKDTPVILSDFWPYWYEHYLYRNGGFAGQSAYDIRRIPEDFNLQLEELDSEYDRYRFYEQGEADWTGYTGDRRQVGYLEENLRENEIELYRSGSGFAEELDRLADSILILLHDKSRFENKDIIVDYRNLTAVDRAYIVNKVQAGLPEDTPLSPFIKLFPEPTEYRDDYSGWDLARVFYQRVLFDPCPPLSEGFPIPSSAVDCHFTGGENFFIGLLGDCEDDLDSSNLRPSETFQQLRDRYFRAIYDYDQFEEDGSCKQYVLITDSPSSVPYEYTDCATGRLLRNSIVASSEFSNGRVVRLICSTTKPRLYGPEADIGRLGFCNTCFTEDDPRATDYIFRSIYQVQDAIEVQSRRYDNDPDQVREEGFRIITDELEFPYFREE